MQLSANITFNPRDDCFVGFNDFGGERGRNVADHALVLMVCGIRKRWKQPLAYYFVHRTVSTAQLYVKIKDIIRNCRKIGLNVLCTVCDQGSTNRGAIRMLMEETNRVCIEQQVDNKYFGYLVDKEEVLHIYDPPHLLQCLRNTFLDNNIQFEMRGKHHTAKWLDIATFFEYDKGDYDIRLIPKLYARHVYKEKMNKMKVSTSAQIFSQRLSAVMRTFAGCGKQTNCLF